MAEQKSLAKLAERHWMLSLPQSAYTGQYTHPDLGTILVELQNNALVVSFGNMRAKATPYPEAECMRLELVPGSGTVLQFQVQGKALYPHRTINHRCPILISVIFYR